MREYIVAVGDFERDFEEYIVGYIREQKELIRCGECRYYFKAIPGGFSESVAGEHAGLCRHSQGCVATDPEGYCHYARRKE